MIKILQSVSLLFFVALGPLAYSQDIPAVTAPTEYRGFSIPDIPGTLNFSVSLTESARSGYYSGGGEVYATSISGDAAYLSFSPVHPFSMIFSGGYSYITSAQQSSPFLNLSLSQTFNSRNWNLAFTDSIRYLPEAPSLGLSGLGTLGDLGIPNPTTGGLDILTSRSQRVLNTSGVSGSRNITGSTSITGAGNYSIQRFIDSPVPGNDYNQVGGQGGLSHRIDALSSIAGNYNYTHFSYINASFSFTAQSGTVQYTRQWNRRFHTDISVGPQFHHSSNTTLGGSSLGLSANIQATYNLQRGSLEASYVRGVQGGSGVVQGSSADTLRSDFTHRIGEFLNLNVNATYAKHHQLFSANAFSADTVTGGAQLSRTFGQNFSGYVSYIAQHQSAKGSIVTTSNTFGGLSQTISAGISYSPRPIHLGH
jgi:hypothetical protein